MLSAMIGLLILVQAGTQHLHHNYSEFETPESIGLGDGLTVTALRAVLSYLTSIWKENCGTDD